MKSLEEKIRRCLFKIQRHEAFEEDLLPHVKFRYYGGVPYLTWDVSEDFLGYVTARARVTDLFTLEGTVSILDVVGRILAEEEKLVRKFGYETRGYGLYWKRLEESVSPYDGTPVITGLRMVIHHNFLEREEKNSIEITKVGVESDKTVYGVLKGVSDESDLLLKKKYNDLLETLIAFEKERTDLESITRLPPEGRDLIMKSAPVD